ncbi:hypothetical protein [Stenotrophomonas sp. YIM B06876]|uniref:hypothetical protein n=1 Tax=Stenotrophomonas sp. YIM B06876 TaxID=3060211 RepID=UPI00273833A7|nr:hypothetical protein [Stenotrophomonas sp. YIM B06876]
MPGAFAQSPAMCEAKVLEGLGWQLLTAAVAQPRIEAGAPCDRADLPAAQAAGDLRVLVPAHYDLAQHPELVRELLQHPATRCAFGFELGAATRRATRRLQDNSHYRFSALQLGWIGFGMGGAQAQGWQRFRSFGRGYAPLGSNSRALETFYSGRVRSECGVGRQVAQLATLRELFGDAAFDQAFTAGELSIGTFLTLHDTPSVLLGASAGERFADGKAQKTARLGRQAFVGAPGFIEHVFDRSHLDDIHNQAENFVITDVSAAAAAALARHDGFAHYDRLNRRIWEIATQMPGTGRRRFERLLYERDRALRQALPAAQQPLLRQLDQLLADPFYAGFEIYVHPKGVRPVGYHIVRLLDRNPRTPYSLNLALHNLPTTIWQRWLHARVDHCGAAGSAVHPPPPQ